MDASAGQADDGRGWAAKGLGERPPRREPRMPEWSNPAAVMRGDPPPQGGGGEPGEVKHLSTPRNGKNPRSSGERTGVSLNPRR